MTVFGLMGFNIEQGGQEAIVAGSETLDIFMPYADLEKFMGSEVAMQYADPTSPTGLRLPPLTSGQFTVSGVSAMMADWEQIRNMRDLVLPLFQDPNFQPYLRAWPVLKSLEERLNLKDENIRWDDATCAQIEISINQAAAMAQQQQAEMMAQQMPQEVGGGIMPETEQPPIMENL
jgi:hypothetical protein